MRVQSVQNFAARLATGVRKCDHITASLKQLHWLQVAQLLKIRDIAMTFKCVKGLAPPYFCNKFKKKGDLHTLNTRNRGKLDIPFFRSATRQRSFVTRTVRLWNDLFLTLLTMLYI